MKPPAGSDEEAFTLCSGCAFLVELIEANVKDRVVIADIAMKKIILVFIKLVFNGLIFSRGIKSKFSIVLCATATVGNF